MRGFAVKFYTEEGNWDMVGNNTPVFFVRDPYKFGDFIHTQKRDPRTNMRSATAMWDFWSLSPESPHQVTILMGGLGEDSRYNEPPLKVSGDADRYDHRDGNDDYAQPGNLFRLMSAEQKRQLFSNIAEAMAGVPERIKARQLAHFYQADPAYGSGVAALLDLDMQAIAPVASLSLEELFQRTSEANYAGLPTESSLPAAGA